MRCKCRYNYAHTAKQCFLLLCLFDNVAPCLSTCCKLLTIFPREVLVHVLKPPLFKKSIAFSFHARLSSTLSSASQTAAAYLSLVRWRLCSQILPSICIAEGAVYSLTCLLCRLGDCRSPFPRRKTTFLVYPLL